MKIVHLSYAVGKDYNDPEAWLKRIDFFVVIMEQMTKQAEVRSIHCINHEGILKKNGVEYHFVKQDKFHFIFPIKLHSYIRKILPDIVIVQGLGFSWQVLWLRFQLGPAVKIILQHRAEKPFTGIRRFFQRWVDNIIHLYFFSSLELAKPWIDQGLISRPESMAEVMGLSSIFKPIERITAQSVTNVQGKPVYLWVGGLDSNKNPLMIVEVFLRFLKFCPSAKLYLIFQTTELLNELHTLYDNNSWAAGSITFVGKLEHDQLLYWYCSADFIVSTSYYESSGASVIEGMSCGCIPILTNIPAFRTITGNGECGLLYEVGDKNDLLQALRRSEQMNTTKEQAKALRRFNEKLSAEAIAKKMIHALQNILKDQVEPG